MVSVSVVFLSRHSSESWNPAFSFLHAAQPAGEPGAGSRLSLGL